MAKRCMGRINWSKVLLTSVMAIIVTIWIYPIFLSIITSLKSDTDIAKNPFSVLFAPTLQAYITAWRVLGFKQLLLNSILYSICGSLLAVLLGIVPAYCFTRIKIPGRTIIFEILLTTLMLPQQTVVIPLYNFLTTIGLLNTKVGLIIVHGVYGMAFELLLLAGFVGSIPHEIEMAARVDGCSDFGVIRRIIIPLAIPAAAVGFVLNCIDIWKEFFFALVFLSDESVMPITTGILKMTTSEYFTSANLPAATVVLSQLPIVILFILAYRWITSGIYVGAVKG